MTNSKTRALALSGLFAALTMVSTMIIRIPTPTKGYIHVGDTLVYLSGAFLGPQFGFLAAAIGSALADLASGYAYYAPITFIVKGLDAFVVALLYGRWMSGTSRSSVPAFLLATAGGATIMVLGYFSYEVFLYGFWAALISCGANIIQAVGGMLIALPIYTVFIKNKSFHKHIINRRFPR